MLPWAVGPQTNQERAGSAVTTTTTTMVFWSGSPWGTLTGEAAASAPLLGLLNVWRVVDWWWHSGSSPAAAARSSAGLQLLSKGGRLLLPPGVLPPRRGLPLVVVDIVVVGGSAARSAAARITLLHLVFTGFCGAAAAPVLGCTAWLVGVSWPPG
ncbi:hypothetical protein PLESTM_001822000 [Pleodorina starrii]|nr:hypothetical protein PLESTM_001822000 [Pleodorina starrii]